MAAQCGTTHAVVSHVQMAALTAAPAQRVEDLAAMAAMKAVAKDEMAAGVTVVIGQNATTHRANASMFRPATPPKSTTLLQSIHKVPMGLKPTATNHVQSAQVAMVNE